MWETCDKPCGGGNRSRVRSCTHPPPIGGGDDCEGPWNETLGCNTSPCPGVLSKVIDASLIHLFDNHIMNTPLAWGASLS